MVCLNWMSCILCKNCSVVFGKPCTQISMWACKFNEFCDSTDAKYACVYPKSPGSGLGLCCLVSQPRKTSITICINLSKCRAHAYGSCAVICLRCCMVGSCCMSVAKCFVHNSDVLGTFFNDAWLVCPASTRIFRFSLHDGLIVSMRVGWPYLLHIAQAFVCAA